MTQVRTNTGTYLRGPTAQTSILRDENPREAYLMRKTKLLSATALNATLGLILASAAMIGLTGQAVAATSITTATTTPVLTSVTGDLTVSSAGSIKLTTGTAITVDSNNTVTLSGPIDMSSSADLSTGILIDGGHTSNLSIAANITVTDNYTATDTKNVGDLILDGPFSDGKTRYGIRSRGTTPFIGNVGITAGSTIKVEGDNSYGILFENKIQGDVSFDGTITMEGNNNAGISLQDGVTGKTYLSGVINVHGKDSSAVRLGGDYGGMVELDGSYTSTGYATITSVTADQLKAILTTPEDMYQSGPTVSISGNVAGGILVNAIPVNVSTNTSTDQDGDGFVDTSQNTASITNYGTNAALRIAGANDIAIGALTYGTTAVNPPATRYGLLIRGSVTGNGLYSAKDSKGVELGSDDTTLAGHVTIANGIGVAGSVTATAYGATARGLLLQAGASAPLLDITGSVNATAATALTTDDAHPAATPLIVDAKAIAIDIKDNATLPSIHVGSGGSIVASTTGSTKGNATAILDESDTLTSITNNNVIGASITASDDNGDGAADTVVNRAIAIDTRNNTQGLTLTQVDLNPTDSTADKAIAAPYINGDIWLGSGNDVILSNGGLISSNIDFGDGANSITFKGSAIYLGKMTGIGTVAFDDDAGKVGLTVGSKLNVTTLHVGATSTLALTLDTDHPTSAIFTGTGAATFDTGAILELTTNKLITTPTVFTVLSASNISLGGLASATLDGHIPYLYHADLTTNAANTTLFANFRLKNKAEGAFSDNQYSALAPILSVVAHDPGATSTLLGTLDKANFDKIYNQYLPDYSGENLINLALGSASLNKSLGSLTLVPDNDAGQWWLQEYGYKTTRKYGETAGFDSTGFSFAAGREREIYGNQMLGLYLSYTSATPLDSFAIAKEDMVNSDLTLGGYWRFKNGPLKAWAHAGGGFNTYKTTRNLLTSYLGNPYSHVATAKWNGYSYSGGLGASAEYKLGVIGITPQVLADYYAISENKHTETGGQMADGSGDFFDLTVAKRDGHLLSSTAMINVSYGRSFIKPELWVGYKENLSATIAKTVANFANTDPFTLSGGDLKGGGPIAGFRISADNQYSYFSLEGDYEKQDAYTNVSMALRARFQF